MKIFVPGKLMLSGEWCVLEKGMPCIVMAVDVGVSITIECKNKYGFYAPDLKIPLTQFEYHDSKIKWKQNFTTIEKAKLFLAKIAMELTLNYLHSKQIPLKIFTLSTSSADTIVKNKNGKEYKMGLGSSAAISTGIVAAILQLHDFNMESSTIKKIIFKIACLAHYIAQEKLGSGFDIAASVWGGILYYKKFDSEWLSKHVQKNNLIDIIDESWPGLYWENLVFPDNIKILVGFVGYSANTKKLIHSMSSFKDSFYEQYYNVMQQISEIVEKLKIALKKQDEQKIIQLIKENRYRLQSLNDFSHKKIETEELATLANIAEKHNAAGKFSGAGGGDCGIAVVRTTEQQQAILHSWQENQIIPVNIKFSSMGARVI